jgi:hypothetical protein
MLVAIAVLMGGIAAVLAPFTLWILLMLVLVIAGITVMELARYLALGRPYVQNIVLEALASMAVLIPMSALAFASARTPLIGAGTSNAIAHMVMPAIVVIVWFAAIHGVRRAYAAAAKLPHPFLEPDERRVVPLGSTDS